MADAFGRTRNVSAPALISTYGGRQIYSDAPGLASAGSLAEIYLPAACSWCLNWALSPS